MQIHSAACVIWLVLTGTTCYQCCLALLPPSFSLKSTKQQMTFTQEGKHLVRLSDYCSLFFVIGPTDSNVPCGLIDL